MNEEKNIYKNKLIISIATLVVVFIVCAIILLKSTLHNDIYFHYVANQNTGEPIGLFGSLIIYALFFGLAGTLFFCPVALFVVLLYSFLHRKEFKSLNPKKYHKHEEELYYGVKLAAISTYAVVLVLMILHLLNICTVDFF